MTESSSRTWGSVRIAPGPAGLKTRPDKPVSGHGRRAAHYRVNRDARASGVRFAELNSQHSLSLVKRGPGTLPSRPRRPRHEQARRGQDRGCRDPPAQAGTLLVQATPRRPRSGDIRPTSARRLIRIAEISTTLRIRGANRRNQGTLPACRWPLHPYGPVWVPCHASRATILSPTGNKSRLRAIWEARVPLSYPSPDPARLQRIHWPGRSR
jgi:hypothetical protein